MSTFLRILVVLSAVTTIAACGPSTQVARGTDRAVGADAEVTVESVEGGNRLVGIHIRHLPPPERVAQGKTRYVLWFSREGQASVMASGIQYDPDERTGSGRATTPLTNFEVVVTAEGRGNVVEPSEHVVVRHRVR